MSREIALANKNSFDPTKSVETAKIETSVTVGDIFKLTALNKELILNTAMEKATVKARLHFGTEEQPAVSKWLILKDYKANLKTGCGRVYKAFAEIEGYKKKGRIALEIQIGGQDVTYHAGLKFTVPAAKFKNFIFSTFALSYLSYAGIAIDTGVTRDNDIF